MFSRRTANWTRDNKPDRDRCWSSSDQGLRSVRRLVERGLLEQSEDDAKIFVAHSPKDVLIPLLEKEDKQINRELMR